jgi:hypothetical protein
MHLDWDTIKYLLLIPAGWFVRLMWSNHKSIQGIREELAKNYPTWPDLKDELRGISQQQEQQHKDQKEDLHYIRDRVDEINRREIERK